MFKINDKTINNKCFPDNSLLLKLPEFNTNKINIEWKYEDDSEIFTLICIAKHYQSNKNNIITLICPYLCHARMDRVKNSEDVFTLKYFCNVINSLNFYEVWIKDVHSNVALALLDRVKQMPIDNHINYTLECIRRYHLPNGDEKIVAFYPDEGAMKRYSETTSLPYAFGIKKRDWETSEIKGLDIMNKELIQGENILIIDDICSKGGTFYHSAKALKEAGAANIYLYITHCENTIFEGELLKDNNLIKHIFTTNSILTKEHEKITIV